MVEPREALEAGIRGEIPLVVYQWRAWGGFLVNKIAPDAVMIEASPDDHADRIIERLPATPGAFLFHINSSLTEAFPVERRKLISALRDRGWIPCNDAVVDIRKRAIQERLGVNGCRSVSATRQGAPDDLMVVKSDYNYGGRHERTLSEESRAALGLEQLPPSWMNGENYLAIPRAEVAEEWWNDASLTVERFVGNRDGHYFR
ncbi:MAG: hypothetical protein JRG76_16560, partial [Deltaproteobacteria bacterium]|nr:hypothetical protein [Deltaproteobacteria bacterium]